MFKLKNNVKNTLLLSTGILMGVGVPVLVASAAQNYAVTKQPKKTEDGHVYQQLKLVKSKPKVEYRTKTKVKTAKVAGHMTNVVNIDNQEFATTAAHVKAGAKIYNRPQGVKNSKAVKFKFNTNTRFMVYQKAHVYGRKGTWYKVVEFDHHSHRGFVQAKDVHFTSTFKTISDDAVNNVVFLSYPGKTPLYKAPLDATFKPAVQISAAATAKFANDSFKITNVAVVNGSKYYRVVDISDVKINGWLKASNVKINTPQVPSSSAANNNSSSANNTNNSAAASSSDKPATNQVSPSANQANTAANTNRYFDASQDILINFSDGNNVVASQVVALNQLPTTLTSNAYVHPTSNDRVLNNDFIKSLFSDGKVATGEWGNVDYNNALAAFGYTTSDADLNYGLQNLGTVKVGSTITIPAHKVVTDTKLSNLNFGIIAPNQLGQWNPEAVSVLTSDSVNFPALNDADTKTYKDAFTGNQSSFVDFAKAFSNNSLFKAGGSLASFDGGKQNVSVTSTNDYTNGQNGVLVFKDYASAQKAFAAGKLSLSDPANKDLVTTVPIGGQYHNAYFFDNVATTQANPGATLYGTTLKAIYDQVPVKTPAPTATNSGFTGYLQK